MLFALKAYKVDKLTIQYTIIATFLSIYGWAEKYKTIFFVFTIHLQFEKKAPFILILV